MQQERKEVILKSTLKVCEEVELNACYHICLCPCGHVKHKRREIRGCLVSESCVNVLTTRAVQKRNQDGVKALPLNSLLGTSRISAATNET